MPDMGDLMKEKYCKGDNSICARHMVFKALGRTAVPDNLFPLEKGKGASDHSEGEIDGIFDFVEDTGRCYSLSRETVALTRTVIAVLVPIQKSIGYCDESRIE